MSQLITTLGGPTAVARMLGIKAPSVIGWNGRIPGDRCPAIERATDGRVTVEEMRPDVRWQRVPDAAWPHPEGRPCLDVAGPSAVEAAITELARRAAFPLAGEETAKEVLHAAD